MAHEVTESLRVAPGGPAGLAKRDPGDRLGLTDKEAGLAHLTELVTYLEAYENIISETSTSFAPWYVVPADHNWVRNLAVAELLAHALQKLDPQLPPADPALASLHIT